MLYTLQTLSHLAHLFFFETLTRGHTVSLSPVSLRTPAADSSCLDQNRAAPVLFWMDHFPHLPPSQNVARAERGQPVPRLCFHYQRTWALSAQQMPRCTHRCRSWLFLAPIYSFALISCFSASPWFLFPPHSTPQNCKFFSNTNFPFEPPTFRAVSHAGRASRHRVGVVRPKELTSVSRKVVPTVPRPSTTAWGHPYPCTPPSPFRFLSSLPSPTLPGGLTPESSLSRREQRSRLLPLPAQNPANPLLGSRRRGCRDGVQPRAPLRGPSTDLSLLASLSPGLGSQLSLSLLSSFTAFLNNRRGQAPRCVRVAERGTRPNLAPIHPAKVNLREWGPLLLLERATN